MSTLTSAEPTATTKWTISAFSALLFFAISSPFVYMLVNSITSKLGLVIASDSGCPNYIGVFVHALVFMMIVRFAMGL